MTASSAAFSVEIFVGAWNAYSKMVFSISPVEAMLSKADSASGSRGAARAGTVV